MFVRNKKVGKHSYLQIVENRRDGDKVCQKVLFTVGKTNELIASGKLDAFAKSFLKLARAIKTVDLARDGSLVAHRTRGLGPALVFQRLWEELGIPSVLEGLLAKKRFSFPVERAIFVTVLHRLFDQGSDRAAERWKDSMRIEGAEELKLHHFYRAMDWLGERLIQLGNDPLSQRCVKDEVEERLFARNRDLFSELSLVFFDTTSIYFEGSGGQDIGRRGHSKDSRPDLAQMVVGAVVDGNGRPLCCELWPGNVTDVTTLLPVARRLRERFHFSSLCVVADRGMISKDTIEGLEGGDLGVDYILGVRMRNASALKGEAFQIDESFVEVNPPRKKSSDPSPLKVAERVIEGKRYVICYNEEQARKDRHDREAIVASLREKLEGSDKNLVGNAGYRKYLSTVAGSRFVLDEAKVLAEARFDGLWILTTNLPSPPAEVARHYKELWMVEDVFRSVKSVLETRPIYHQNDASIRGHVFCSFLALMLLKELEDRLARRGTPYAWDSIKRDLSSLQEIDLEIEGQAVKLRTELQGCAADALAAAGVVIPPRILG